MSNIPKLTSNELTPLIDLRNNFPVEFYRNVTHYYISEMQRYIKEKRVWRNSIMGETRGGKSEVGSAICFLYMRFWNSLFNDGFFDNLDLFESKRFKKQPLKFDDIREGSLWYVCDNQQIYKQRLKDDYKDSLLKWGEIWQIDEEKKSEGGVGSVSDIIETNNLNNIIAKFCQSEIWIQPERFETHNCPFGLKVVKKDEVKRVNWCLLFKMESEPNGSTIYRFLGWVKIPLHENSKFRKLYNNLKDAWIEKEISGRVDQRMILRSDCAELLVKKYRKFFELKDNNRPKYSRAEQLALLNQLMIKNIVVTNFNELEKEYIIVEARMIIETELGIER